MENFNYLLTIVTISIFISLFLAVFLITVSSTNKLSNRLFALFLILSAIDASGYLYNSGNGQPYNLEMFRSLIIFLQLPTLYMYVQSALYQNFKLQWKHLIHALPFIVINLLFIQRFYGVSIPEKIAFLDDSKSMYEIYVSHLFLNVQIVFYLSSIFLILQKTKKIYLQNYTGDGLKLYQWLFRLLVVITVFYIVAVVKNMYKLSSYDDISDQITIGLYVMNLVIICWYLLKALKNPTLFKGIDSSLAPIENHFFTSKKQQSPSIDNTSPNIELQKLQTYMEKEQPFLNASLTIQEVSDAIDIPVRELSVLINNRLGQHFFDFVNSYRIKKAQELLTDSTDKKRTVLEILYEVGFNSKSSFNTSFKKHTGVTPTAYRKTHS